MSFGYLIYECIKKAATRHLEPAPIAIHAMHPSDVAQSFFRHRRPPSLMIKFPPTDRITYQPTMTTVVVGKRASVLIKTPPQSVLVSVAIATYAALQGDAHG
jgi:hypothetical protein